MERMSRGQFIQKLKEIIGNFESGKFSFVYLPKGHIFINEHFGELSIPLAEGVNMTVDLFHETEEEIGNKAAAQEKEPECEEKPEKIKYGKYAENLIEFSLAYANLAEKHPELSDIDSVTWKQMLVEWANEFEDTYPDEEYWEESDYLECIEGYAEEKILTYAGLEGEEIA